MSQTPPIITDLVKKFERNIHEYRNPKYNETLIRVEFVNPFWKSLGWDVDNEKGYAMAYRDVIHEDELKVGRTTRAPDYAFRVGGRRIFFLETKKPAVDLKHDPAAAFQLRRYAYSAKLPVSLLTDFEELIVYDCRIKPAITDKPHIGRMMYYTFQEYTEKWEEISSIFSKEAVMQGAFDRFIEDTQDKRPRAEIDRDFLNDLDKWRIELARNIALRNPELTERELNYAVQLTIDRLIFFRMCEDRDIEQYETLMTLLNGNQIYRRLVKLYYKADHRYNSGLFHFEEKDGPHPDILTPKLEVDDKILKQIISELYYPKCPYEFSVLPVEVLGNAYEQFLGKRITLTEGHRARIEEKPEVRKAGGVYYTPQYIVDYIVKNTVGKLCEGKTPRDVSELRILDPACGSGSFLLGAYQYLLDWHVNWYRSEYERTGEVARSASGVAHGVKTRGKKVKRKGEAQAVFQGKGGEWYLTTAEKKRILTNNIFGVDIDANAVEVTKLSLLLKVLEHETSETLNQQLGLWKERALPNLESNIKCGNSLIGTDFYEGRQAGFFNEEEALRVNAFDWEREFPEIFARGGFDAVIGNPPYVRQALFSQYKDYFQHRFKVHHNVADLYSYFIEKGFDMLKNGGHFSYIVSNKWIRANYGKPLRQWLRQQNIEEIIDFGDLQVFKGATTYPCIIKVIRAPTKAMFRFVQLETLKFQNLSDHISLKWNEVNQENLDDEGWVFATKLEFQLIDTIKSKSISLKDYLKKDIYRGILTGLDKAFVISKEKRDYFLKKDNKYNQFIKPYLIGKDIQRYKYMQEDKYVILIPKGWTKLNCDKNKTEWNWFKENFPEIADHLYPKRELAEKRYDKGDYWWELRACDYYNVFENPKIIYLKFQVRPNFTIDSTGSYPNSAAFVIPTQDLLLLGILNSKLGWYLIKKNCTQIQNGYQLIWKYFSKVPICKIEAKDTEKKEILVGLVEQILGMNKKYSLTKDPHTRELLQRQIDATDRQIDHLVYQLYGLTEEEIRIVEGNV